MKRLFSIFTLLLFIAICLTSLAQTTDFDQALADSLGADEYGMKIYTFVILKTGTKTMNDQARVGELFRGHLDNIGRLVEEGKLVVAGPFMKNEANLRGLFILNVEDMEEARALLSTDPAIEAGLLEPELYQWYGSAALPMYLDASKKVAKKKP